MDDGIRIEQTRQRFQAFIHGKMHLPLRLEGEDQPLALDKIAKARGLQDKEFLHGALSRRGPERGPAVTSAAAW